MNKVTWTAKNNSSFLNGDRSARTIRGAVIAARRYVADELYGEGIVTFFVDGYPIREDERSMRTNMQWRTKLL